MYSLFLTTNISLTRIFKIGTTKSKAPFIFSAILLQLFLFSPNNLKSQDRYLDIFRKYSRPQFYTESVIFPTASPDSVQVYVNTRLSYDNLYFVKGRSGKLNAEIFISLEVFEEKKLVSRKTVKRLIETDSFTVSNDRNRFVEAHFTANLGYKEYEYVLEVYDNDRQRQIRVDKKKLTLKKPESEFVFSQPLMLQRPTLNSTSSLLQPIGLGGNGVYGKDFVPFIQVSGKNLPPVVTFTLFQLTGEDERFVLSDSVTQNQFVSISGFRVNPNGDSLYVEKGERKGEIKTVFIPLDFRGERLANARFKMVVNAEVGGKKNEITKKFETSWADMPFGLYDLTLSIRLMEYITPPDSLSGVNSGNIDEQKQKFLAFWKSQDPTPETDYNEVMAEYFKRVDFAFLNFYTPREFGWRTDRGKTWILYGEPNRTEREFPAGRSVRETWYYEEIKRKFIFVDRTNTGSFELEKVEAF
ncbi:MAG: GWxTD domain-containing protein [Chloroherpetonaceae bacterium]|nr:GWxTD domain-containing protein [Chloroherpetonaceae bacterium]